MTFGSTFGRTFSPTFNPKSLAPAVASSWWLAGGIAAANCIAAYQPKGAADYAASKVNLANAGTNNAADGTAYPTWDATNGWKFAAASSQYLTTGITPTKTWSVLIRLSNITVADSWVFGNYAASGWGIQPLYSNLTYYYSGTAVAVGRSATSGVYGLAGAQGYYNGSSDGAATSGNASPNAAIFIGDISGTYRRYFTGYVQAFSIYNITITSTQVGLLTTAMAAL